MQYELAKKIRRQILTYEIAKMNSDKKLAEKLTWNELKYLKNKISLSKKNREKFVYYLYLSLQEPLFIKLFHLLSSGDIFKISIPNSLRILYYQIKGLDLSKY